MVIFESKIAYSCFNQLIAFDSASDNQHRLSFPHEPLSSFLKYSNIFCHIKSTFLRLPQLLLKY